MSSDMNPMLVGAAGAALASVGYLQLSLTSPKTVVYIAGGAALPYIVNTTTVQGFLGAPNIFQSSPTMAYAASAAVLTVVAYKLFGSSM